MKFILKGQFKENPHNLMRMAGYCFQGENERNLELSFTRPARGYPRFHLFLRVETNNLAFNLHLDQKKPSYKGFTAHAGEHNGKIIENEIERIKKTLENNVEII